MMKKSAIQLVLIFSIFILAAWSSSGIYEVQKDQKTAKSASGNMPVVITTSKYSNKDAPAVFFISGDGGWYKFEQSIADKLSTLGIPTIGLDTKKYFWNRRTPEETASDVLGSLNFYSSEWERKNLVFVGYSLGAEVLPFIISRLPEDIKSRISLSVMLSPSATTDFEIHFSDMLGIDNKHNTYKVVDEILRNKSIPALCIFGSEEKTSVPSMLKDTRVKIAIIPGNHHYNFDSSLIIKTMKDNGAF